MNLQTIETIVRRLFTDTAFRSRAIADPSVALVGYHLAAGEQVALTKLCVRLAHGTHFGDEPELWWWWC